MMNLPFVLIEIITVNKHCDNNEKTIEGNTSSFAIKPSSC